MKVREHPRQVWRGFGRRQDYRNNRVSSFYKLVEESLTFLILPRAKASIAHENRCRIYAFNLVSECRLPRGSGPYLIYIQPRLNAFLR
jgi:hypothetical protein